MASFECRVFVDGVLSARPPTLREAADVLRGDEGVVWIGLRDPDPATLDTAAELFALHPLAIEDTQKGHQRAKIERYGDALFVVIRPSWYAETVEFGEVHLFIGHRFVITVRRGERPDLTAAREALEADPEFLGFGPEAMVTALLDALVDGYAPVVARLQDDVDGVEDSLFGQRRVDPQLSERIYHLLEKVIGMQRAVDPLSGVLRELMSGGAVEHEEVRHRLRNVLDHTTRVSESVDTLRSLLESSLSVHSTLISLEQNEEMRRISSASLAQGEESRRLAEETIQQGEQMKKISSWAAILFTPTLVAGVYGMNFDHMPELHWLAGYPFALALMLGLGVSLWIIFKHKRWL
ncbi:magnesium and cobalt transport protein CorA [Saccharopolyspora flava]|uniref:Magnesium transporter n=1 Tax=Saccharopolyspora flava TaxID=95161 RepID=A0A1I6V365_9PSEU|nr:magnesium and cobalt transport protein CorA [Saccharopolyspora flava]SFT08007.1 magnesium transporter [Saccharopolyspora flava]